MAEKTTHEIEVVGDTSKAQRAFDDLVRAGEEFKGTTEKAGGALKGMSADLRTARTDMRNAAEAQRDAKNAIQEHKDAVKLYGAASDQAKASQDRMRAAVARSTAEHQKAQRELAELRQRIEQARQSTEVSEAAVRKYERQLEQAERQMKATAEAQRRLGVAAAESNAAMAQATQETAKWTKALFVLNAAKTGLGLARSMVVSLGREIKSLTLDVAAQGDEVAKTAKKYGATTDELQRLRFAADRSGASAEKLTQGLGAFTKRLEDAAAGRGSEGFVARLQEIGVSVGNLVGEGREGQLGMVGDALSTIEDKATRTAIAMELFGEDSGPQLVPFLLEGTKGMKALGDEAERLGGVIGGEALAAGEEFTDRMADFQAVVKGLKVAIGTELLPVFGGMLKDWGEWIVANKELIATRATDFIKRLVVLLEKTVAIVTAVVGPADQMAGAFDHATTAVRHFAVAAAAAALAVSGGFAGFAAGVLAVRELGKALGELYIWVDKITDETYLHREALQQEREERERAIEVARREQKELSGTIDLLKRQVQLRRDIVKANEMGGDFVFGEEAGKRKRKELLKGRRFESLSDEEQKRIRIAEIDATLATPDDVDRKKLNDVLHGKTDDKRGGSGKRPEEVGVGLYARRIDDSASIKATNEVVEARMASEAAEAIRQETAAREERIEMLELEGELRKAQIDASLGEEAAAERAREIDAEVASQKFQLEQELTDFKIEHAETRAEVIDLETERKKRAMREEIRAQQELQARERKILEQRTAAFMKMGGITGDVLGQVAVAAAESVGAEDDAFARSVQQMAKAIRNQMIMVSVKEAALAAAAAASSFGLSPEVEAHAIASAAAAAAAVVAGTVAGAIGAGLPAETGGSAGGGGGSPAPSASSGGGRGGGRSESQAPVSRATPTPAPSVSPSGATNVIHIHVGTLVGADEAAVEEIAKAIEKRLRRAV